MKRVYKLTPVSQYDIAGLESWLEDMARRGLFLKKFRPLFCTFQKSKPEQARYRIEPHRRQLDDDLPQSMLELYGEFGWTCVGEIDRSMLIFSTRDPQAPELHTDPELQWEQWNKLRRSAVRGCWSQVLLLILVTVLWVSHLFGNEQPVLNLITSSALPLALFSLFTLVSLPGAFAEARQLSLIARQLKEGIPLDHRAMYPRHNPASTLSFLAAAAILLLLILSQYILPLTGGGARPLDELTGFSPLPLSALEGAETEADRFVMNGVDYANFCDRERYLLCRNQWEVIQTGRRGPDGLWVRMEIQWYDLSGSLLAVPLAREQLDRAMASDDQVWWRSDALVSWTVDYPAQTQADFLAVARRADGAFQAAAVAAGNKAAVIRYTGHGDLSGHLEEIAAMVIPGT